MWKTQEELQAHIQAMIASGARLLPESIRVIDEYFCGCSEGEMIWEWVRDYLAACEAGEGKQRPINGPEYIATNLLDHLGLTEHGGSIRGAWLTDLGKQALAFLREFGIAWEDKEWIDSTGCSRGALP